MQTPYWNNQLFKTQALAAWNLQQPAWTKIKRYEELTPAEHSIVDGCADELEYAALIESTKGGLLTHHHPKFGQHHLDCTNPAKEHISPVCICCKQHQLKLVDNCKDTTLNTAHYHFTNLRVLKWVVCCVGQEKPQSTTHPGIHLKHEPNAASIGTGVPTVNPSEVVQGTP